MGFGDRRKKGTVAGLALIGFGIIGAIVGYVNDRNSFDYFRMSSAGELAIVHLVLWTIGGLVLIAWFNRRSGGGDGG